MVDVDVWNEIKMFWFVRWRVDMPCTISESVGDFEAFLKDESRWDGLWWGKDSKGINIKI